MDSFCSRLRLIYLVFVNCSDDVNFFTLFFGIERKIISEFVFGYPKSPKVFKNILKYLRYQKYI